MIRIKRLLATLLDFLVEQIPASIAKSLEWRLQKAQGKGIGYASVVDEVRTLKYFIQALNLNEVNILDIGANFGQYGLQVISKIPNIQLHSFEPSKSAYNELELVASPYKNWSTYNFGFGSKEGSLELFSNEIGSASASLLNSENTFGRKIPNASEIVEIKRLDDFLQRNGQLKANILKLDVEGYELNSLEGTGELIRNFKIVQFEFGEISMEARTYFRDFWNYFNKYGFTIHRITRRRPIQITEYNEDLETFRVTNYLAVREF